MTQLNWQEQAISKSHNRSDFDCGALQLNPFLKQHARQNHDKGGAKTFVALDCNQKILGFYSLSIASIAYEQTAKILQKGLSRHIG